MKKDYRKKLEEDQRQLLEQKSQIDNHLKAIFEQLGRAYYKEMDESGKKKHGKLVQQIEQAAGRNVEIDDRLAQIEEKLKEPVEISCPNCGEVAGSGIVFVLSVVRSCLRKSRPKYLKSQNSVLLVGNR